MKTLLLTLVGLAGAAALGGCSVGASAYVGYTEVGVGGDIALTTGSGGTPATAHQDIESAFGLGEEQGSPYARVQGDLGFVTLTGSGFLFSEDGTGTLNADFGGISASTPIESSLDFANAKISATFDFGIGPVTISPGLAVDVCDVQFSARELTLNTTESVDELLFVPLVFVRGEVELGGIAGIVEIGYLQTPEYDDAKSTVLDVELLAEVEVAGNFRAFAGYRLIDLEGYGETDGDSFDIDLEISGWMIGGALRF